MKDTRMDRCHRRAFYCAQPPATMTDRNGPATDGREGQQLEREEFESTGRRSAYALLRMLIQVPAAVRRWPADKMSRYVLHYPRHPHIRKRRHGSNSSDGIDQNVPPPPSLQLFSVCVCVAYFFFFFLILFSTVGEKEEVENVLHRQLSSRFRILYSTVDKAQARFGQAIYLISFFYSVRFACPSRLDTKFRSSSIESSASLRCPYFVCVYAPTFRKDYLLPGCTLCCLMRRHSPMAMYTLPSFEKLNRNIKGVGGVVKEHVKY